MYIFSLPRKGGLDLIGKAAVLKTAGLTPLRVRVPHPPPVNLMPPQPHPFKRWEHVKSLFLSFGEVTEWPKVAAC